jgi:hypothetical protein
LPRSIYQDFFRSLRHGLVVEQSHQGQLHRIIRMWTDVPKSFTSMAKSGANPITPGDVLQRIVTLSSGSASAPAPALNPTH